MADNIQVTQGAGTVMATDDIGGVQFPRVKLVLGANNTNDGDVASGNPMPVTGTVTAAQATAANLNATVVGTGTFAVQAAQSGTWDIGNVSGTISLPNGAATETTLSGMSGKLPATLGQKTMANSLGVAIASDQGNLAVISNNSEIVASANFTRPANTTAYAAGDLVANNTTAGSVVPLSWANIVRTAGDCVRIERVRVEKSGTSLTNASFRLHLFEASPTVTVGDNGVFNTSGALATDKILNHAGAFPVTMVWSGTDGAIGMGVPLTGPAVTVTPSSGTTIYGLLEVTAAYTPASGEVFYVILEGYRT